MMSQHSLLLTHPQRLRPRADRQTTDTQERRFAAFLSDVGGDEVVVVEMGAGTALPTIRRIGEHVASRHGARLVRINPREAQGPPGTIVPAAGALEALEAIDDALASIG